MNIRELISKREILILPGVYDALTAKVAEKAGFKAILMGGFSISAIRLGQPDVGYLTMSEMVSQVKIISDAVPIPLIADGDTGYGNPLNVMRTVRDYEKAGAAGIILEDQQWPKRCGHMEGKQVIPLEEHVKKLEAALEARSNRDFIIIARTDSLAVNGMEEAVKRGRAYRDAGADVVFVEAPKSVEELVIIRSAIKDVPLVANIIEGGKTPLLSARTLEKMGYEIMFYGLTAILIIAKAFMGAMTHLKREGNTEGLLNQMCTFSEFNELIGIEEFSALEKRFKQ
jgi:2-methylisocitrate lyase-like PEP mutase family enzyme